MGTDAAEAVRGLVAPVLESSGYDLYDVELAGATLRVLVDREGGVDLEALGALSGTVSGLLDAADPLPGRYVLEVSSPGLERPLRTPAHFEAAVGRRVTVRTRPGATGERRLDGELVAADDEGVVVSLPAADHRIGYDEIERARTVFEWGGAPKPGDRSKTRTQRRKTKGTP